jgi:hypothetical protein
MNLEQVINNIESMDFSIRLNVVSSLTTYLHALRKERGFQLLYRAMATGDGSNTVSQRLNNLAQQRPDARYENPHDVALSVYTLLLYWLDRRAGKSAAEMVSRVGQCWWATRIAKSILQREAMRPQELSLELFGSTFGRETGTRSIKTSPIDKQFVWWPGFGGRNTIVPGKPAQIATGPLISFSQESRPLSSGRGTTLGNWHEVKAA